MNLSLESNLFLFYHVSVNPSRKPTCALSASKSGLCATTAVRVTSTVIEIPDHICWSCWGWAVVRSAEVPSEVLVLPPAVMLSLVQQEQPSRCSPRSLPVAGRAQP